jgi:hypothetical protein
VMSALDAEDADGEFAAPIRLCSTCKHHSRPKWDTQGMGSCGQVVRQGLVGIVGDGYVTTHETHACSGWTDPKKDDR